MAGCASGRTIGRACRQRGPRPEAGDIAHARTIDEACQMTKLSASSAIAGYHFWLAGARLVKGKPNPGHYVKASFAFLANTRSRGIASGRRMHSALATRILLTLALIAPAAVADAATYMVGPGHPYATPGSPDTVAGRHVERRDASHGRSGPGWHREPGTFYHRGRSAAARPACRHDGEPPQRANKNYSRTLIATGGRHLTCGASPRAIFRPA